MRLRRFSIVAILVLSIIGMGAFCHAQNRAEQLKHKADLAKQKAEQWVSEGRNPSQALMLLKQASQEFQQNHPNKGEALIDEALSILSGSHQAARKSSNQHVSDLYAKPQLVEIRGYNEDAMEPCISLDGQYLFFNGNNESNIPMHIASATAGSNTSGWSLVRNPAIVTLRRASMRGATSTSPGSRILTRHSSRFGLDSGNRRRLPQPRRSVVTSRKAVVLIQVPDRQ